jgi:hypothetical protein
MNKLISTIFAVAVLSVMSFSVQADPAPIQFSFFDFNAPNNSEVKGVRFPAIYGKGGGDVTGVDFGLLAYSEMKSLNGVALSLFPTANRISGEMNGVVFGVLNWHEGQDTGVNFGIVNKTNEVKGANLAAVNIADGHTSFDLGVFSKSDSSVVQLGLVNVTEKIEGVQIGLLNCAKNGFLPCFIFVNFAAK